GAILHQLAIRIRGRIRSSPSSNNMRFLQFKVAAFFKVAVFFASLFLGVLAVSLFLAGQMTQTFDKSTAVPHDSNSPAKKKTIVCSLGEIEATAARVSVKRSINSS